MNISAYGYVTRQSDPDRHTPETTLAQDLHDHHDIMMRSGETLTGEVALVSEDLYYRSDRRETYPGSMQVWSKTAEGDWVYVNPEGVVLRSPNPIGE